MIGHGPGVPLSGSHAATSSPAIWIICGAASVSAACAGAATPSAIRKIRIARRAKGSGVRFLETQDSSRIAIYGRILYRRCLYMAPFLIGRRAPRDIVLAV